MAQTRASNAPSGPARSRRVMVHVPEGEVLVGRPDQVAIEEPLEIRLEAPGQADPSVLTVIMRTPGNDIELVAGWLLAEGVIDTADDVAKISYCVDAAIGGDQRFNVVTARLRRPARVSGRERTTATSSACGICGTASIDALRSIGLPPMAQGPRYSLSVLASLPEVLRAGQRTFEPTGSVHGVALVDDHGEPLAIREDVGRHNAVDKAIGWALLNRRLPLPDTALVVSGRVSFEIVQKAARAGLGLIAAVSGATSLAVSLAEEVGITLVGFVRGTRCVVYSGPARVIGR
jgi:FdhD protein